VGKTRGRGRQDREHRQNKPIKDIYLYPLGPDCQKRLCEEPGPARCSATVCTKPAKPPRDWAEQEFGRARLRDRRHRERLFTVARDFYAQPAANIPQACQSRAKTKAAYRLFEHKAVKMEAILSSHITHDGANCARRFLSGGPGLYRLNYNTCGHGGLGPITAYDCAQGILIRDIVHTSGGQ
jgi:hypothetical protein